VLSAAKGLLPSDTWKVSIDKSLIIKAATLVDASRRRVRSAPPPADRSDNRGEAARAIVGKGQNTRADARSEAAVTEAHHIGVRDVSP